MCEIDVEQTSKVEVELQSPTNSDVIQTHCFVIVLKHGMEAGFQCCISAKRAAPKQSQKRGIDYRPLGCRTNSCTEQP